MTVRACHSGLQGRPVDRRCRDVFPFQPRCGQLIKISLLLWKSLSFTASTDWMKLTHLMEGQLLYSVHGIKSHLKYPFTENRECLLAHLGNGIAEFSHRVNHHSTHTHQAMWLLLEKQQLVPRQKPPGHHNETHTSHRSQSVAWIGKSQQGAWVLLRKLCMNAKK